MLCGMKKISVIFVLVFCFAAILADNVWAGYGVDKALYNQILDDEIISDDDIDTYEEIFEALNESDYDEFDDLLEDLDGDLLKGHVLAEKYLSKNYVSTYEELNQWLENYYDLPQAARIYRLAERKAFGGKVSSAEKSAAYVRPLLNMDSPEYRKLSDAQKSYVQKQIRKFYTAINKGKTRVARGVLETKKFRMTIPDKYWDEMATTLALVYLLDNEDRLAYQWSLKPARRSHKVMAYWIAGLASWKMKRYKTAGDYFSRLANVKKNDAWLQSAGGFWAYRAYMRQNKPKEAQKYLKIAAKYNRTFYGILASYILGNKLDYKWEKTTYWNDFSTPLYAKDMVSIPAVARAVALFHAKRPDLAEDEINKVYKTLTEPQKEALMFWAEETGRHSLALRLSNNLSHYDKQIYYDAWAYPIPEWEPKDGWKANKALLLAVTRQESSFDPEAVSPAGARGLMQLLPSTAAYVTKDKKLKKDKSVLFEVDYNLSAGQKYVNYLLNKDYINGDLFLMLTAYNAGPGNLLKWQKKMKYQNDPLLFIELIPAKQTRIYIERVMANFWLYSLQLGQNPESLELLKSGQWPVLSSGVDYQ